MADYITRARLKNRLLLRQIPLPDQDSDLDTVITTASDMVSARVDTTAFTAEAPPASVQQVTLMLALAMWTWETMNAVDANGHPITADLWTPAMTQALGSLVTDPTPDNSGAGNRPAAGVMSKTAPIPSPSGYMDANADAYTGSPNPGWATRRIMP